MKRAIVLSGGGARGAYEVGVWKAFRKLKINADIVTGTSVGALNGALMVQKSFKDAVKLWSNMNFSVIFKEKIDGDYKTKKGKKEILEMYAKNIAFSGGMEPSNLFELIQKTVDEDKIRKSNIDFGLITVKYPSLKPCSITKTKIPKGKIDDYLMASSACYPAFQKKQISGQYYIDGGFYDNMPINLACDMGADEVIAIDLEAIGKKQKIKNDDVNITIISPRHDLGSFLVFDSELSNRNIIYGYTDTLKKYRKLDGNIYTFKKNQIGRLNSKFIDCFLEKFKNVLGITNDDNLKKAIKIKLFKKLINYEKKENSLILCELIEELGKIYEIDDTKIYRLKNYNKLLKSAIESTDISDIVESNNNFKYLRLLDKKKLVKYLMKLIVVQNNGLFNIAILFPKEFLCAFYMLLIFKKI